MQVVQFIRNLIKFAKITKAGTDDKEYPIQQVSYNGKASDIFILFPYGMHANLINDSIVGMFSVNANEQNRFGIGGTPDKRIRNLPQGEVVFFHPVTKSKIHFKNSGDIDIETNVQNGNININTGSGNVNVNCQNANVNATSTINYTAPTINLNGDVNVSGLLTANGGINIPTQSITIQGKDIGPTHHHFDGTYVAGNVDVSGNSGDVV